MKPVSETLLQTGRMNHLTICAKLHSLEQAQAAHTAVDTIKAQHGKYDCLSFIQDLP